ncbi:thiamine biosynthesis protein ThiF [Carbonactinospora thermoautotrophica]|uniref:ThiF family adenylyltransferase n=1 Tax=Carbonactinospora thermoautotrophica TaxID=1469144 RepID=UPI00227167AA|nr:ThiF family adenylyltransferase [Carbonactinospora thermoautotrophica]MCX9192531.1 thiamine biosynthesis protein ThiF [Carbonactinospora thermoautotrophica]
MRPTLKPGLRRFWRDQSTFQIGLDPDRAVLVTGADAGAWKFVSALDGTRDRDAVLAMARRHGIRKAHAAALLDELTAKGLLDDATTDSSVLQRLSLDERDRLRPDLAAISLQSGRPDAGLGVLQQRRSAAVEVHGCGRVGASVARLLAAAGVGCVVPRDDALVRPDDLAPAGHGSRDRGATRERALARALQAEFPTVSTRLPRGKRLPDLVILAPADTLETADRDVFLRQGVPHLYARVRETRGLVGPLVLPGRSSCQRCHDHHMTDRDPGWPYLVAELVSPAKRSVDACDVVLATMVAAHTALQALAFLQGEIPSSVDSMWEITLPDGVMYQRTWGPHPRCGCVWPAARVSGEAALAADAA